MNQAAHIFNPVDDSFTARLDALKETLKAYRDVEKSLKISKGKDIDETLGSDEVL